MTIKHKLAFSFVIMIFLVAVVGVFMFKSSSLRESYNVKIIETINVSHMVQGIGSLIEHQFDAVDYFILFEEDQERRKFEEYLVDVKEKFGEWYDLVVDEALKEEIVDLERMYMDSVTTAKKVIKIQLSGKRMDAMKLMDSTFIPRDRALRKRFEVLVKEKSQLAEDARRKAKKIIMQQTFISLSVILVAVLVGGILSVIIFSSITRPLNELKRGAAVIGSGNLDYSIVLKANDEFGELAGSFNEMAGNLKKMQAQIIQLDRMSAMGQLAGGVAHELNNPLTGVLGQAQVLLARIPKDSPQREQVQKIERAALRCRKIVRELLDFSRQKEYVFQKADIQELIESTLLLCESDLNATQVHVVKNFSSQAEPVAISPPHVQQVFLNLINNAMHAMQPGGTLTITTSLLTAGFTIRDRRKDQGDIVIPGKWLEISFTDNGTGIESSHLSHVFDPFFTTKEVGKGTGLGLTISYGIIQNHKGTITVESKGRGRGSTFIIRLPYKREMGIV